MKKCIKCKKTKELSEFYFRKDNNTYRNECKTCIKKNKQIREEIPGVKEKRAKKEKEYRQKNKDNINKRLREQRSTIEGKERIKENYKRFKEKHPEKVKAWNRNKHAKRKDNISMTKKVSGKELDIWCTHQLKICSYCGITCDSNYHVDHIEPINKGGLHQIENLTISCPSCNCSKSDKSLIFWFAYKN